MRVAARVGVIYFDKKIGIECLRKLPSKVESFSEKTIRLLLPLKSGTGRIKRLL